MLTGSLDQGSLLQLELVGGKKLRNAACPHLAQVRSIRLVLGLGGGQLGLVDIAVALLNLLKRKVNIRPKWKIAYIRHHWHVLLH